jgi:SAM-dependent methyltransferase
MPRSMTRSFGAAAVARYAFGGIAAVVRTHLDPAISESIWAVGTSQPLVFDVAAVSALTDAVAGITTERPRSTMTRVRLEAMSDELETNRAWWDERAALHGRDGFFYDVDGFLAGDLAITQREVAEVEAAVGSIHGIELLYIQCHIGLGTLSLARLGARVTGLDFSHVAIERARQLAAAASLDATFLVADAQRLPAELRDRFDCAFASHGCLMWIADIDAWMSSAAAALRPGGTLVLVEGHPLSVVVRSVDPFVLEPPYQGGEALERHAGDYAHPDAATTNDRAFHYRRSIGEVVTAAARAGLRIDALTEWTDDEIGAPTSPKLRRDQDGRYRLRVEGVDLPLVFGLRATKPA